MRLARERRRDVHPAIRAALARLRLGPIEDPAGYRNSYASILRLFREFVVLEDRETVEAGALAVYGWMPRVLRAIHWDRLSNAGPALNALHYADRGRVLADLSTMGSAAKTDLMTFVNGSVIGTSKFLHFWNPEGFAIWDRRIASLFGISSFLQVNSPPRYQQYLIDMNVALDAGVALPRRYMHLLRDGAREREADVSEMRALEFALFLSTGAKADLAEPRGE